MQFDPICAHEPCPNKNASFYVSECVFVFGDSLMSSA